MCSYVEDIDLPACFLPGPFELYTYVMWEGVVCSFTPMLVNSDGWDGDHSSPGGGLCVMHVLLLLLLIVRVHLHK